MQTLPKFIFLPVLSIRVMQSRNAVRQRFPSSVESLDSSSLWANGDSIEISSRALLKNGENGAVRVVFATYNHLDQLLEPASPASSHHSYSRSHSNSTSQSAPPRFFVNSKVISASLGKGRHIELSEPVSITFKHLRTINVSQPTCVYWDYLSNAWSGDGCKVTSSNRTHTKCRCNHLTNFALLMREGGGSGYDDPQGETSAAVPLLTNATVSTHVSTIVAGVAALISICVIAFFLVMGWRRLKMSNQCRNVLEKSGLPCFHKSKDLAGGEDDKGNRGNFYTVTPKMNGVAATAAGQRGGSGGGNGADGNAAATGENADVAEREQYFEHMISLQKNPQTTRRNNVNNSSSDQQQETNLSEDPSMAATRGGTADAANVGLAPAASNVVLYPKRTGFARALSPYNHIYMEIDPTEVDPNGKKV